MSNSKWLKSRHLIISTNSSREQQLNWWVNAENRLTALVQTLLSMTYTNGAGAVAPLVDLL